MHAGGPDHGSLFEARYAALSVALVLTTALVAFESLSVVAALAEMADEFGSLEGLPWVITGFLLASGIALVVTGDRVDAWGARPVYRAVVTVFLLSSALCAVASGLTLLVVGRVLQGLSGGAILATTGAAVGVGYPAAMRSRVYAMNATVWGVLAFAGPALGGLLLAWSGWRAIFWVNVPLAAIALVFGWKSLPGRAGDPDTPDGIGAQQPFDRFGTVLLAIAFAGLVVGVAELAQPRGQLTLVLGAVATWLYVAHSRRVESAVLSPRFSTGEPYRSLALAAGSTMAAGVAVENYLPLYLQVGRGMAVQWAAWGVVFLTVGWTTGANVASRLYHRIPESRAVALGASLMPAALALDALLVVAEVPLGWILAVFFLLGCSIGVVTNAALTLVQAATSTAEVGRATSAHQFARNLALTVGTAAGGLALVGSATQATPGTEAVGLAAEVAGGFAWAHLSAFAFSLVAVVSGWRVAAGRQVAVAR